MNLDSDRIDYFDFNLSERKEVRLRLKGQEYDADLYLEDPDGNVIHKSENAGAGNESINAILDPTAAGEYYYVRVEAKEDGRNDYKFRFLTKAPPNSAATGIPTITGTAQVRETLTAGTSNIADDNGLSNAIFAYQWVRSADGVDTAMSGATASTFLLTHDELDHTITVRVSFTDDDGYSETVASNATAPLAALLLLPGQVRSQLRADVTLVSNAGQESRSSDLGFTNIWALGFVTGSNSGGYNLSSIALIINASFGGTDPNISIWSAASDGEPDSQLFALTNPPNITSLTGEQAFAAPANTVLAADTRYLVHIARTTTTNFAGGIDSTDASGDDAGAAAGWSIDDITHYRSQGMGSWISLDTCCFMKYTVEGSAVSGGTSNDATLSGLAPGTRTATRSR